MATICKFKLQQQIMASTSMQIRNELVIGCATDLSFAFLLDTTDHQRGTLLYASGHTHYTNIMYKSYKMVSCEHHMLSTQIL